MSAHGRSKVLIPERAAQRVVLTAVIFEEHSSVLPHWLARGVRGRTLVYLDAHLDLQPVGAAALQRLRDCADAAAVRALEAAHPFGELEGRCFGIEDFLHPAAQLGCIRRVVWVAPPQVWRAGFGAALARLVQMPGITLDDLQTLRPGDRGGITGRLLGLDLTLCTLPQLAQQPLPADWLLDIDADYFVELPGDRLWADPLATLAALRALPGAPAELTISRSVGSGFTPLRHRFLADLLAAAWTGDTPAAQALHVLVQADRLLTQGQRAACLAACADLLDKPASAAAAHHLSACAADSAGERAAHGDAAARWDPTYADQIDRDIAGTHSRRLPFDRAGLARWQRRLEAGAAADPPAAQRAWVGLGLLHAALGDADAALHAWAQTARRGRGHPELALEAAAAGIAQRTGLDIAASVGPSAGPSVGPALQRALDHPGTEARAFELAARAEAQAGRWPLAMQWQQQAARATPAHPGAWQRLAHCCQGLGDAVGARAALARQAALQASLAAIATRLVGAR